MIAGRLTDMTLLRCSACRFVSGSPTDDLTPAERYRNYYEAPAAPSPEGRYHEWMAHAEAVVGIGRLLEIGAGSGGFATTAKNRGWRVDATEVSKTGAKALAAAGVDVFVGELHEARYPDASFDLVVALEVIEHVPKPGIELWELWRVLRPGGLALLTTPNYNGLSRHLLGNRWRVIAPEHLGYFTTRTLGRALHTAGFSKHTMTSRGLDVSTWRATLTGGGPAKFDPQRSAALRDQVNSSWWLRSAKEGLNSVLGRLRLGDTLLAWAQR